MANRSSGNALGVSSQRCVVRILPTAILRHSVESLGQVVKIVQSKGIPETKKHTVTCLFIDEFIVASLSWPRQKKCLSE